MHPLRLFAVALLLLVQAVALADSGHIRSERYRLHFIVEEDGRYTLERDDVLLALTEEGQKSIGKRVFDHNTKQQDFEIVEAETIKADGRRIPVKPDAIETQSGVLGMITQRDIERTSVTFPDLKRGDRMHVRTRLRQREPVVPGAVFQAEFLTDAFVVADAEITLDAPVTMQLGIDANLPLYKDVREGSMRRRVWRYTNAEPRQPEYSEVDTQLTGSHVIFSNWASWDALAADFGRLYRPKAEVTDAVRELSATLAKDATTQEDKARHLYDWVRSNVRYVGTWNGTGAQEPHSADWVLENRYGDCKDHVVLLEALLRAAGIESTPALVALDWTSFALPKTPYPYTNHVITYVPSLDLYLDSTADTTPYGLLPEAERDKAVVRLYDKGNPFRVPMDMAAQKALLRTTILTLHADGSAKRETRLDADGLAAVWMRDNYARIGPGNHRKWAMDELRARQLVGSADLVELADDKTSHASYEVTQQIDNFLRDEEVGVIDLDSALNWLPTVPHMLGRFLEAQRTRSGYCAPVRIEERIEVRFDKGVEPLRLPRDRHVDSNGMRFDARYARQGDTVTGLRRFEWQPESYVCSAAEYRALAPQARKILGAVQTGLVYQRVLQD
jgi:hypothetical protein